MKPTKSFRWLVGGAVLGVGLLGGGVGALALDGGSSAPAPAPTVESVTTSAAPDVPDVPATVPTVDPAPPVADPAPAVDPGAQTAVQGPVSQDFSAFKAGGPLPAPPPLPDAGQPVTTVPGPAGPIYPDGYVDPAKTAPPVPLAAIPPPPPVPGGNTLQPPASGVGS